MINQAKKKKKPEYVNGAGLRLDPPPPLAHVREKLQVKSLGSAPTVTQGRKSREVGVLLGALVGRGSRSSDGAEPCRSPGCPPTTSASFCHCSLKKLNRRKDSLPVGA